jgi:hypothetical protein
MNAAPLFFMAVLCAGNAHAAGLGFQDWPVLNTVFAKVDLAVLILSEFWCGLQLKKHWTAFGGDKDPEAGMKIMKGFGAMLGIFLTLSAALWIYNMTLTAGAPSPSTTWTQPIAQP